MENAKIGNVNVLQVTKELTALLSNVKRSAFMEGAIKANVSVRRGIKAKAAMRKFALMTVRIMEYAKGINAKVRKISMELTAL